MRSISAIILTGDELAQVAGHRRLERDQLVAALLELERPGVELVVGDGSRTRRLRGPARAGSRSPWDRLGDRGRQLHELVTHVLEMLWKLLRSGSSAHQPNRPVTYASVRSSLGLEKIFWCRVELDEHPGAAVAVESTSVVKNAVRSLTRAACCMLWVTMMIV